MAPLAATPVTPLSSNPTTLIDGAGGTLRLDLASTPGFPFNYLLSAIARIDGTYLTSVLDSGPLWAEVWIQKGALLELVDKGYIRYEYGRGLGSVVGFRGVIPIDPNAIVLATIFNESGATQDVRLDVETQGTMEPLPVTQQPLSLEHHATYIFEGTILENAAGGGDHSLLIADNAGDAMSLVVGTVRNGDASARNFTAFLDDGTGGRNLIIMHGVTDAAQSIAATTETIVPNAQASATGMAGPQDSMILVKYPMAFRWTLAAVAQTKTTKMRFACFIRGRKPATTLASTGAAPTLTKVRDTVI